MTVVVLAPDSFKGSLTAAEVAEHLAAGLRASRPDLVLRLVPVADGGEGTLDAALGAGYRAVPVTTQGPTGASVRTAFAMRGRTAVVELAAACGLGRLPDGQPDPLRASSFGAGQLVRAALDAGCDDVVLGVGGSASTDGGAGLLCALGARVLDAAGRDVQPGGADLVRATRLDLRRLDPRLRAIRLTLASDVDSPLTGPSGAAVVFGPQKGAGPDDVRLLDVALRRWAEVLGAEHADRPGAGAAGGVGFAALAVLGATRRPGVDVVLDLVGLVDRLRDAGLVVTGEGCLDEQTLRGKAPLGVARAAGAAGAPVIAVCGQLRLDHQQLRAAGFAAAHALTDVEPDLHRCRTEAGPLLRHLARTIGTQGDRIGW